MPHCDFFIFFYKVSGVSASTDGRRAAWTYDSPDEGLWEKPGAQTAVVSQT